MWGVRASCPAVLFVTCFHFTEEETEAPGSTVKSKRREPGPQLKRAAPKLTLFTDTTPSSQSPRPGHQVAYLAVG